MAVCHKTAMRVQLPGLAAGTIRPSPLDEDMREGGGGMSATNATGS